MVKYNRMLYWCKQKKVNTYFGIVNMFLYICNMEEIWKVIEGHPNYMVSNQGRVKSLNYRNTKQEMILKCNTDTNGYKYININGKCPKIHRLVAEAFIPNPENKPCIDHINTDRTDCRVENLRFVTTKENSNNPLTLKHYSNSRKGCKNSNHRGVIQFDLNGNFLKEWDCIADAERELNIPHKITLVCQGKRKSTCGYKWAYKKERVA